MLPSQTASQADQEKTNLSSMEIRMARMAPDHTNLHRYGGCMKNETKGDEDLIRTSKEWNPTQWEEHLTTLEGYQRELLIDDPDFADYMSQDEYDQKYLELLKKDSFPHLETALLKGVKTLTPEQQQVIQLYFWENLSLSQIANQLGITKPSVQARKNKALARLGTLFIKVRSKNTTNKKES